MMNLEAEIEEMREIKIIQDINEFFFKLTHQDD
jgi:hypothetical protein